MNLFLDRIIIILLILRLIVSCDDKYLIVSLVEFVQKEMTMEVIIYVLHTPMGTPPPPPVTRLTFKATVQEDR